MLVLEVVKLLFRFDPLCLLTYGCWTNLLVADFGPVTFGFGLGSCVQPNCVISWD